MDILGLGFVGSKSNGYGCACRETVPHSLRLVACVEAHDVRVRASVV